MKEVTLGRTGLRVKRLGFGGIPIQRVDETQAVETVRYAVERGMDFIDTSRVYTTSEKRIGLALQQTRKTVVLASKSKERTADGIRADLDVSLKTLQRDTIDLYQCHFVKDEEYPRLIAPGGALEGLIRLKKEGLIGHMGITSHSLDLLERAVDDGLFDTIMVCFSFMEPDARERVIPKAVEKNIGVIAMKPLSGGVIETPGPALRYAFSQKGVLVLCGVESKELFDVNWDIFGDAHALTAQDRSAIDAFRSEYDRDFCRRCDYCQPCTAGINIQGVLGVKSMVKRMGPGILARPPRTDWIAKARECTECEECKARCPYQLPIPELLKERLAWVDSLLPIR